MKKIPKITKNMLTQLIGDDMPIERLLFRSMDGERIYQIDIHGKKAMPIQMSSQEFVEQLEGGIRQGVAVDPFERYRGPDSSFKESQLEVRERAWKTIAGLVTREDEAIFLRKERGKLIKEVEQEGECTIKTIYSYLRRFWQRGQFKNALLGDYDQVGKNSQVREGQKKRGRPSSLSIQDGTQYGRILTPQDERNMDIVIRRNFLVRGRGQGWTKDRYSLEKCYYLLLYQFYKEHLTTDKEKAREKLQSRPTLAQFLYYYRSKKRDVVVAYIAQNGKLDFLLNHRAILGSTRDGVLGPLMVVQIDPTIADIFLVSRLGRRHMVGKPTLYAIIDVYTGVILMLYASLKPACWIEAMKAIEYMVMDKKQLCEQYGINYNPQEWPCHGQLPQRLVADGGEFEGFNADNLVGSYGVTVTTTAAYRADDKGLVENILKLVKDELIMYLPGGGKRDNRSDKDVREEASLTISEFRKELLNYLIYYNNYREQKHYPLNKEMTEDNVPPYPIDIWNWSLANRVGALPIGVDPAEVRFNLLPRATATVTPKGIRFEQLYYDRTFPKNAEKSKREWQTAIYSKASLSGHYSVNISYDPESVNTIYLWLDGEPKPVECKLIDREGNKAFWGCDWQEVKLEFQRRNAEKQLHAGANAFHYGEFHGDLKARVNEIREEAREEQEGTSKTQRIRNIRTNRAAENKSDRQLEAPPPSEDVAKANEAPDKPAYIPPPSHIDIIRQTREKRIDEQNDAA